MLENNEKDDYMLTDTMKEQMVKMFMDGLEVKEIARVYSKKPGMIYSYMNRRWWKSIKVYLQDKKETPTHEEEAQYKKEAQELREWGIEHNFDEEEGKE